ncbi:MAG TPA: hypothetical protein VOA87_16430 [Thermoanaerobaculia bacterium]|nr:hypothetical protein [Thermoanaerobaculia bacterium]
MKKRSTKLELHRETLLQLDPSERPDGPVGLLCTKTITTCGTCVHTCQTSDHTC